MKVINVNKQTNSPRGLKQQTMLEQQAAKKLLEKVNFKNATIVTSFSINVVKISPTGAISTQISNAASLKQYLKTNESYWYFVWVVVDCSPYTTHKQQINAKAL